MSRIGKRVGLDSVSGFRGESYEEGWLVKFLLGGMECSKIK